MSVAGVSDPNPTREGYNIVRMGYMRKTSKKTKTASRKWFVLRRETPEAQARLEYYDSEKTYQSGKAPKKTIPLKTCFNINQVNNHNKYKNVIALYTKDECLSLAVDDEDEADIWFKALLSLQKGEDLTEGEVPRPTFEHVWDVAIVHRGLGNHGLIGLYRICLTENTLSLFKKDNDSKKYNENAPKIEFKLSNIRSCGHLENYIRLEVGRSSSLGAGELWMETEDQNIAQNVHLTIYHAMTNNSNKQEQLLCPKGRIRSSSATEASKPNSSGRKQSSKPHIFSQGVASNAGGRERCDSMPSSRARTSSEGNHPIQMFAPWKLSQRLIYKEMGQSPPSGSPISPPSIGTSTDSAGSSYSLDEDDEPHIGRYGHSLTPDEAIAEEECDSPCPFLGSSPMTRNYIPMNKRQSDEGYVDMSPKGRHSNLTPAASLSSVTSGTPSTDLKFSEYTLDKVSSFFPPSSDEENRPIRAYSVGSRPKKYTTDGSDKRVRASSVGSKKWLPPGRILQNHHYPTGHKSSSAPLLSNGALPGSSTAMDDLMEMDFTKRTQGDENKAPSDEGYVEMKPGVNPQLSSSYLDMRAGSSPKSEDYTFVDVNLQYNLNRAELPRSTERGYMDMNLKNSNRYRPMYDYTDTTNSVKRSLSALSSSPGTRPVAPKVTSVTSPASDYMDMHFSSKPPVVSNISKTPEGYMEMTVGKSHHRQSSLESAKIKRDEYSIMAVSSSVAPRDSTRSQPININNGTPNQNSTTTNYALMTGTNLYTDSSPKMQLPLTATTTSPYSSLPRRSRNNSRRDSKDSSSSSVTTPSSSSTIFPLSLNSPSSPTKPLKTPETNLGKVFNAFCKAGHRIAGRNNKDDYTCMNFNGHSNKPKVADVSEYVNYDPCPKYLQSKKARENEAIGHERQVPIATMEELNMGIEDRSFRPINEMLDDRVSPRVDDGTSSFRTDDGSVRVYEKLRPGFVGSSDPANASRQSSVIERSDSTEKTSRPGSTTSTSESCSSSSTLVNSRPDSVNSDPVKTGISLHYASLDLQCIDDDGSRSPRSAKSMSLDSNSSNVEPTFTYAEIDFNKSATAGETYTAQNSLANSNTSQSKIKH